MDERAGGAENEDGVDERKARTRWKEPKFDKSPETRLLKVGEHHGKNVF
jgi:hypothetical protein